MTDASVRHGFELRELRLCGPGQVPGSLVFASGLNVIEGASDTGKSYALSCIDFVMGAGMPPEEIVAEMAAWYPQMDDTALTETLSRAIFVADTWGRLSAQGGE